MSIKNKLKINALLGIITAMFMGSVLLISTGQIKQANQKVTQANKIVTATTEMRFVTFEYLIYPTDRALEQWKTKYQDISNLLAAIIARSPEELRIIEDMRVQHEAVKSIFERLTANHPDTTNAESMLPEDALEKQLTSQLLIRQQTKVSSAFKLAAIGQAESSNAINRSNIIVATAMAILLLSTAINFSYIHLSISRSLDSLLKGAEAIAGGQLNYRIWRKQDDEFGGVAAAFNVMAAKLQEIDKVKSEFVLLATDQLRKPLASIKASTDELLADQKTHTTPKQQKVIQKIHTSNEKMMKLANTLLEVTKIDFGALAHKAVTVQLAKILDSVLQEFDSSIKSKKLTVNKQIDNPRAEIIADPSWLRVMFHTLLSNAIKYSPTQETITVSIEQQSTGVLISIADNGYGIPEADKEHIFSKSFRGSNAQQVDNEGTGLSLYITRSMVELSGGTIWFKSTENQGTTFYVKLLSEAL